MNYILEISLEGLLSSKRDSWGLISTFIPEKDLISQRRQTNICSNGGESQIPHPSLSSSLHQSNSASCWKLVSQPQSCSITWAQVKSGLSQHKTPKIFLVSVQPCFRKAEEEEETSCLQGVSLWQRDWVGNRRQQTLELPRWSVTSIVNLRLSVLQRGSWSFLIFPELLIHKLFVWEQRAASPFFYNMFGNGTAPRRWRSILFSLFKNHKSLSWCKSPELVFLVLKCDLQWGDRATENPTLCWVFP